MATTAETLRAYRGPAILSYGFRPFFLGGSIWAAAAMALFIPMLQGHLALPTALNPIDWHQHELLYGFVPAIVAGFLLTAVPNWTGRLPVAGAPLAALFALWLLGRAAVATSALIGAGTAAAVDLLFLIALGLIVGREILASGNKNNMKVLVLVSLLAIGNLVFHVETATAGTADFGKRIGIAAAIMLISLIGGRIVPSFTRNWLAKQGPKALPAPFGRFDVLAIASSAIALAAWIFAPASLVTAAACGVAGVLHLIRLARWRGYRTAAEPLVTILHVGYLFVPLGFLLMALAIAFPAIVAPVAAVHAWTAGAIGIMTLAVMTRASLGHTGHELKAAPATLAIYSCVIIGAPPASRLRSGSSPRSCCTSPPQRWILAFGAFSAMFGPILLSPQSRRLPLRQIWTSRISPLIRKSTFKAEGGRIVIRNCYIEMNAFKTFSGRLLKALTYYISMALGVANGSVANSGCEGAAWRSDRACAPRGAADHRGRGQRARRCAVDRGLSRPHRREA